LESERRIRIAWLVPDDLGGGVISVAQGCCRQATRAGHDATLLLLLTPAVHASEFGGLRIASLNARPPYADAPSLLVGWLQQNPQDILVLNGCEQADVALPYISSQTRVVYAVHDTAHCYFDNAVRHEGLLNAIVAVSETVAAQFRHRLEEPKKLHVILNGTIFPLALETALAESRTDELVFLGGDNPVKGAHDVLALSEILHAGGFQGRIHWFGHVGEAFRARIDQLRAAVRIVVHGRQPRRAVFETAARAKIVLMLSRVEPFGLATVECMGMGCSPVAWDIATGTREIVGEAEGFFVPLGDYDALARGVHEALMRHASSFAKTTIRIRNDFSEEAMWARYQSLITAVAKSPPALRPQAGQAPPCYRPPFRKYQLVPAALRATIRAAIGRSPHLGYKMRDFRGW
jgi:glycosyltransferase involved in cell wall biosynthesis